MDWCDKNAPEGALEDVWELIRTTPMLDWQMLTKRATLIADRLPADWGDGYDNVWLGVTVENMEFGSPRIDALRKIPAKVRFLSCEPLLEALDDPTSILAGIDWVIVGGESGPGYRPMRGRWAAEIVNACHIMSVPVWFKQHGGNSGDKGGDRIFGREFKQWPASGTKRSQQN